MCVYNSHLEEIAALSHQLGQVIEGARGQGVVVSVCLSYK